MIRSPINGIFHSPVVMSSFKSVSAALLLYVGALGVTVEFARAQVLLPDLEESGTNPNTLPSQSQNTNIQLEQPIGLTPQDLSPEPSEGEAPTGSNQYDDGWTVAPQTNEDAVGSIGSGSNAIEINHLSAVTSDSVGTLTPENGGLSPAIWQGTRFESIDFLLRELSAALRSPAVRSALRRLLLSQATPPDIMEREGAFIERRLQALSSIGETKSAASLLSITPGRSANPRLVQIEADVALSENRLVDACALASTEARETTEEYWQKLLLFCQVLAGSFAEAQLGISLMRELGTDDPGLFLMLDSMMHGNVPILNDLESQTPLYMAVVKASNARLGEDILGSQTPSPVILAMIAANTSLDPEERLISGEQAFASGTISADDFRAIMSSVTFSDEQRASPLSSSETMDGHLARALLYQAATKQSVQSAQAEAVSLALRYARRDGLYASTIDAFMDVIRGLPPRSDLVWFAGDVIRAFVLTGYNDRTAAWLQMLAHNATVQKDAKQTLVELSPLLRLAGINDHSGATNVRPSEWLAMIRQENDWREKAALLFSLLDSLGSPVPPQMWESLREQPYIADIGYDRQANENASTEQDEMPVPPKTMARSNEIPDPALWFRLLSATNSGRAGEAILLAALVLGENGAITPNPVVVGHVIRSLGQLGLEREARALAIEAAITSGL